MADSSEFFVPQNDSETPVLLVREFFVFAAGFVEIYIFEIASPMLIAGIFEWEKSFTFSVTI